MVKIQIRERDVEVGERLRAHIERRLSFALARFGPRIARVVVRLSKVDEAQAGLDRRCQIDVGLRPRTARSEDVAGDLFAAVDGAAERLSRSIARVIERERDWQANPAPPRSKA